MLLFGSYFSLFEDSDGFFGSSGPYSEQALEGSYEMNPPFGVDLGPLLDRSAGHIYD